MGVNMADKSQAQKLAAARKMLKEYKRKNLPIRNSKKQVVNDSNERVQSTISSGNITPAESIASSTQSAIDACCVVVNAEDVAALQTYEAAAEPSSYSNEYESTITSTDAINVSNFFNNSFFNVNESNHLLSNYFDTIPTNLNTNNVLDAFSENDTIQNQNEFISNNIVLSDAKQEQPYEVNSAAAETQIVSTTMPNQEVTDHIIAAEGFQLDTERIFDVSNQMQKATSEIGGKVHTTTDVTLPERWKSECALDEPTTHKETDNQNLLSNTENLRQLSSQINSLIGNELVPNSTESELERRNQELAALFENERRKNEELSLQLREYMTRITQIESELQQTRNEHEAKLSMEVGPLQEQLQYHIQTVGILVGEKTELTMALNQSQTLAKQKTAECDELHNRLKASKYRVTDLEKEVKRLKFIEENLSKSDQESNRELEKLKLENNQLEQQHQETTDVCVELRDKLKVKLNECLTLHHEIQEKNSQLSLAQLKIEQLTSTDNIQTESQLESLNQQKISLEQQVTDLTQTVKTLSSERGQASQQYQQYVQQLNGQIQNLADSLAAKSTESEHLAQREQSLVAHISELETLIQQLQHEKQNNLSLKTDKSNDVKKLEQLVNKLQMEKAEIEEKYKEEFEKCELLQTQSQEKLGIILELENTIERLNDQPDASKLLAAMESDKVAASRAVEQNIKLKEQLEELHDGFIKISDSKLKLTEDLQAEQHKCRELSEKLQQATSAVEHLHSVIAAKDVELTKSQEFSTDLEKKILKQEQLSDRLKHYEVQGSTSDYVVQELNHTIANLKAENDKLKAELSAYVNALSKQNEVEIPNNDKEESDEKEAVEGEVKVSELKDIIEKLEQNNLELLEKINKTKNGKHSNALNSEYLDKEKAMEKLEERFKKTMAEVANLTEEKQRLEHLVLQLQSETETIGEYVALYQCQRAMLKEKTMEKDAQLQRLARDREEMRLKLEELNALVKKLVIEKGLIPSDTLHRKLFGSSNNCQLTKNDAELEHADMKGTEINGTNYDNNNDSYNTAGKIITLLSEIKTSNLVQPGDSIQNFHPCPWCSGQLLNV